MKLSKHLVNSLFVLTVFSIIAACSQEDVALTADVDVIFLKKIIADETVYGVDCYAYGNTPMSSATVSTPVGVTMLMDSYSSGFTYANITDEDDYTYDFPTIGAYTFTLEGSSDEILEMSDSQDFYDLGFTEIDSISFYDNYDGFYVSWEPVIGAEEYVLFLYNSSGDLIFTSDAIDGDESEYIIVDDYYGDWDGTPISGEQYTLQIQSIIYDANATDLDYYYNIQEVSYSDFSITWE